MEEERFDFENLKVYQKVLDYIDTFDGAKPRFLNRGKKRRSVSTLSIPRASDRGVEWVDFVYEITRGFPKEEVFSLTDRYV